METHAEGPIASPEPRVAAVDLLDGEDHRRQAGWGTGRFRGNHFLKLILLALLLRLMMVCLIGWVAGGQEFTDDTRFQLAFISDPLLLLEPRPAGVYRPPFPPLIPLLMAGAVRPLQAVVSDFYAIRLGYALVELLAVSVIWLAWGQSPRTRDWRGGLLLAYIVSPLGLTAAAVLAQEESIAMLFSAVVVGLILRKNLGWAAWVCGLGVVGGKLYFVVPLLAIVVGPAWLPWGGLVKRGLCGVLPIVLVYGLAWLNHATGESSNSLEAFAPHNSMCVTIYSLLEMHLDLPRNTSLMIARPVAGVAVLVALILARRRGPVEAGPWLVALMASMLLAFYATFSHINPEHWLILIPLLPFAFGRRVTAGIFLLHLGVAVAINVTYGVAAAEANSHGRAPFVQLYDLIIPFPAMSLHTPLVLIFVVVTCGLAVASSRHVMRRPINPRSISGERQADPLA